MKTFEEYTSEASSHPTLTVGDIQLDYFAFNDSPKLRPEMILTLHDHSGDTTIYKEDAIQIVKFLKKHFSI